MIVTVNMLFLLFLEKRIPFSNNEENVEKFNTSKSILIQKYSEEIGWRWSSGLTLREWRRQNQSLGLLSSKALNYAIASKDTANFTFWLFVKPAVWSFHIPSQFSFSPLMTVLF